MQCFLHVLHWWGQKEEMRTDRVLLTSPLIVCTLWSKGAAMFLCVNETIHILSMITCALLLCFFNEPQGCSHKVRWIHNWEHCSALVDVPLKPGLSQNKAHYMHQSPTRSFFSMQEDEINKYINKWLQDHFISSYMVAMPATLHLALMFQVQPSRQ